MKTNALPILLILSACAGVKHVEEYEPKRRTYAPIVADDPGRAVRDDGSLWSDRNQASTLFTDVRAYGLNDLVTVRIIEQAKARRDANTRLDRSGGMGIGFGASGSGGLDQSFDANANSSNSFNGRARTGRTEDVEFTVAGTITQVLPNGNLFIEGHRVVLVNDEEHHFYVSGVARPEDIRRDNSILSHQLADAEIEFTGLGVMSEQQKPGWLTRFFRIVNPL